MVSKKHIALFSLALIAWSASFAFAVIPDVTQCIATTSHSGFAVVLNVPNGNGSPLNEAAPILSAPGVTPIVYTDATISVVVNNSTPAPIPNYPLEDIWLESLDAGMVACTGGATADANTDGVGFTQFQDALKAGGWSMGNTVVLINGSAIPGSIALGFNSPDIDGSGTVNLTDVQVFAGDFFDPGYNFRSDLFFDNEVNLSDLPILAAAVGASCTP